MRHWLWSGAAVAAGLAIGGCATSSVTAATGVAPSPLSRSITAFFHALSVDQVRCGAPGNHGRRSCQVEFTDSYGEWWVTIIVAGSRVISDPGGVADWLCATTCANHPGLTANTGNPRNNPGFTAATGSSGNSAQTGVTGIGGVVKDQGGTGPESVTGPTGVVTGSGIGGTGKRNTGVVYGTGSTGVVSGSGNTGKPGKAGATGETGVVYGTGSTGPGG